MSKVLRAAAPLCPTSIAPPPAEELPLVVVVVVVVVAGAADAAAGVGIAVSAPASACSKSISALDAGSVADCFAAGWLGPTESGACGLAAEVSVAAVPFAGVAASVWASAAEKALFWAAGAEVPDAVGWVAPGLDALAAPDPFVVERAACRPEPRGAPLLPGALEREEAGLGDAEPDAEEPSAAG
ncbi:MAG TPA: hypothetical protein VHY36_10715 [Steroidobacteraceae bacterium]|nr:hypothetical protein [Steroidobacteraceae bacterium]